MASRPTLLRPKSTQAHTATSGHEASAAIVRDAAAIVAVAVLSEDVATAASPETLSARGARVVDADPATTAPNRAAGNGMGLPAEVIVRAVVTAKAARALDRIRKL